MTKPLVNFCVDLLGRKTDTPAERKLRVESLGSDGVRFRVGHWWHIVVVDVRQLALLRDLIDGWLQAREIQNR